MTRGYMIMDVPNDFDSITELLKGLGDPGYEYPDTIHDLIRDNWDHSYICFYDDGSTGEVAEPYWAWGNPENYKEELTQISYTDMCKKLGIPSGNEISLAEIYL